MENFNTFLNPPPPPFNVVACYFENHNLIYNIDKGEGGKMCIDYNNVRIDRKDSECLNPFAIACLGDVSL